MNKLFKSTLSLLVLAGLFVLVSCGDDDELPIIDTPNPPSLSISGVDGDSFTGQPGDEVSFTVNVTAPGVFNTFIVEKSVDGGSAEEIDREAKAPGATDESFSYEFSYTLVADEVGSEVIFYFVAIDDENQETEIDFEVITESPEARDFGVVELEVILGDLTGKAFFSTTNGEVYSPQDVTSTQESISPLIDFGYYYGATTMASLASPAWFQSSTNTAFSSQVANWSVRNNTLFRSTTLDESAFMELATSADIDAVWSDGDAEGNRKTELAAGTVIAFETDADKDGGSKRGVIYISEIVGTTGTGGRIILNVIVQDDED